MTESSDRLDRIEAILATVAESQARTEANLARTEKIAESNARAIQAWDARITEGDQRTQTQLETAIADTVAMIADMGRQQQETDQRFEVFLGEARADRQRAEQRDQANADEHQEWRRRFDQQMAELRAAREQWQLEAQANATEHRAFTQNIQVLLAEIARLWQRIAG
jgi:hypothetical protein